MTTHLHLVQSLRTNTVLLPHPDLSSWCALGQFYLYLYLYIYDTWFCKEFCWSHTCHSWNQIRQAVRNRSVPPSSAALLPQNCSPLTALMKMKILLSFHSVCDTVLQDVFPLSASQCTASCTLLLPSAAAVLAPVLFPGTHSLLKHWGYHTANNIKIYCTFKHSFSLRTVKEVQNFNFVLPCIIV